MANARSGRMQDVNNAKRATGWKEKIAIRQIKYFPITEIYEFSISNAMANYGKRRHVRKMKGLTSTRKDARKITTVRSLLTM